MGVAIYATAATKKSRGEEGEGEGGVCARTHLCERVHVRVCVCVCVYMYGGVSFFFSPVYFLGGSS